MYRDMPAFDAEMGHVLIYSDDILILARTEAGRREIKDAVVQYLSNCPGGPLQLVPRDISLDEPFHFLGYDIDYEFRDGTRTAVARISHKTLEKLARKLPELVEKDRCGRLGWPHGALEHLQNVLDGHPLAVDREDWRECFWDTLDDYNMSSFRPFER
jgi:hypothetical protein